MRYQRPKQKQDSLPQASSSTDSISCSVSRSPRTPSNTIFRRWIHLHRGISSNTLSSHIKKLKTHKNKHKVGSFFTSSDNVETEEEEDTTEIATQTSFVGTVDCNNTRVAFFLRLSDYHNVIRQDTHLSLSLSVFFFFFFKEFSIFFFLRFGLWLLLRESQRSFNFVVSHVLL